MEWTGLVVVDEDREYGQILAELLRSEGVDPVVTSHGADASDAAIRVQPHLAFIERSMGHSAPGADWIETMSRLRALASECVCIVVAVDSAQGADPGDAVETAVAALRRGAFDVAVKGRGVDELRRKLRLALERLRMRGRPAVGEAGQDPASAGPLRSGPPAVQGAFCGILGQSAAMRMVYEWLAEVGPTSATVLLRGDTGTGKELAARALHSLSSRAARPFIVVDCTSITPTLAESELFGHERGAFTGATRTKAGLVELADGGTLFLDEIGDLDLGVQAKLLRLLEQRRYRAVGGVSDAPIDVRVVAATHRDLAAKVASGQFREDLWYRLKVFEVVLPRLVDRADDCVRLAQAFAVELAHRHGKPPRTLSDDAVERLMSYPFPGNVRELRNAIEQAVIRARGPELRGADLGLGAQPRVLSTPGRPTPAGAGRNGAGDLGFTSGGAPVRWDELQRYVRALERQVVQRALEHVGGSRQRAAESLGISRFALHRKLRELGLVAP
jgi:DNA-binding NtrC family response regulator